MVGKLTDVENSGKEEKQTKASDNRHIKREVSAVGKFWLAVTSINSS